MVNTKLLTQVLESLASDTLTNHPHAKENLCFGCIIRKELWDNEELHSLAIGIAAAVTVEKESLILAAFDTILLGIEIGIMYSRAEQMEELLASPKNK